MKRLLWMLLGLLIAACSSTPSFEEMKAANPPKDDNLIVPGWRVGKVYLGMTSVALFAAMGEPDEARPSKHYTLFKWKHLGLDVNHDMEADKVDYITVKRESYRTAEGVKIGLSQLAVTAKLGQPQVSYHGKVFEDDLVYCYKQGMMIVFRSTVPHNVEWISLMPSKDLRQQQQCR